MREIMNYILNNMRGKTKENIEDYLINFYRDGSISDKELIKLTNWVDDIYEPVLSWR